MGRTAELVGVKVRLPVEFIAKRFSGEPEWDAALRTAGALRSAPAKKARSRSS